MNVTQLRAQLQVLESEGFGSLEVFVNDSEYGEDPTSGAMVHADPPRVVIEGS